MGRPDPQAYMAGIGQKMGDLSKARELLEQVVNEPCAPAIRLARCLQLADIYQESGNISAATDLIRRLLNH